MRDHRIARSFAQAALVGGALLAVPAPAMAQPYHVGESGPWIVERWGDLCIARLLRPENPHLLRLDLDRARTGGSPWSIMTGFLPDADGEYTTTVDGRGFRTRAVRDGNLTSVRVDANVITAIRTGRRLNLNFDAGGPEFLLQGAARAIQLLEGCAGDPATSGPPLRPVRGGTDWIRLSGGALAPNAVAAGRDANGMPLFICVARHEGGLQPGKIRQGFDGCNFAHRGREFTATTYSVLLGGLNWTRVPDGRIPSDGSIRLMPPAGQESGGGPLYVCRTEYRGSLQIGKARLDSAGCVFGFGGAEVTGASYEVLTP